MRRGGLFAWSTLPAVAVAGWLALAVPLPALGLARPLTAAGCAVVAVAVAGARHRRGSRAGGGPSTAGRTDVAALAVAAGFGLLAAHAHAEHVVLRRDPGTYALAAQWLATTGRLTVRDALAPVGGPSPDVTAASPGFFAVGGDVVPQFLVGPHLAHAVGWWLAGWTGLLVVPAVLGALALVAFGGLVARLVGAGWAPFAVAVLGLTQPVLLAARSTYSEPLAMLLLLGGLCLLVDALAAGPPRRRAVTALAAGAVLGLGTLVRVDVLREVALLVPVLGWLALRGDRVGRPLAAGLALGCAVGTGAAFGYAAPYLSAVAGSLVPLVGGTVAVVLATALAVRLARRRPVRDRPAGVVGSVGHVGPVGPALVALVLLALAGRPLWLVERTDPTSPGARVVAGLQLRQGLPVDPGRTYAEQSVGWLAWYAGWPALLLAAAGAVLLTRAVVTGRARGWAAPLLLVLGTTVLTLWRPGITPDHPWADRRIVPLVLPGVVLLATWCVAALGRRRRWLAAAGAVAVAVPVALASAPVLLDRTEAGEVAAVERACAALGAEAVALLVDARAAREWPQPLRGACGVPAVTVRRPTRERVAAVAGRATRRGGRPVLVAAGPAALRDLGATRVEQVVDLATTEVPRTLVRPPEQSVPLHVDLWLGQPARRPS